MLRSPAGTVETDEISLITDSCEVRSVDLNVITSVRIAEQDLRLEVGALSRLDRFVARPDVRRMNISTTGAASEICIVSYISECPSEDTYRIVMCLQDVQ